MKKIVYANYDSNGVFVYQAFKPKIVQTAVEVGTFGKGFGFERTSWIKPSFSWTLRRSKYATKNRMEAIAQIKITHSAFKEILEQSVEAHYNENIYSCELDWETDLMKTQVVHQWDPERDLIGRRLERQAIQIGIREQVLKKYVSDYIIEVKDMTELAHKIGDAVRNKNTLPSVPREIEYSIESSLFHKLGCNY